MVVVAMICFGLAWLFGPVDGVIPKPIDPARFAAQVAQWLK